MTFIDQLKPKLVSAGRVKALELDADVFLKLEVDNLQVLIAGEGILHLVSQNESRLIVVRLTEKF